MNSEINPCFKKDSYIRQTFEQFLCTLEDFRL